MYSTQEDILGYMSEQQLAKLTADSGDVVDNVKLNKVIAAADVEIDPYLEPYYDTPITGTIPARVKTLSAEIAIYNLQKNRIVTFGGQIPEGYQKMYDACIAFLKSVAAGKTKIPGLIEKSIVTTTSSSGGYVKETKNIFGGDKW